MVTETIKGVNDNYTIEDILWYDNGHYRAPPSLESECVEANDEMYEICYKNVGKMSDK